MHTCFASIIVLGIVAAVAASVDQYKGSKIYKFLIPQPISKDVIIELEQGEESSIFDLLKLPRKFDDDAQVMVHSNGTLQFQEITEKYHLIVKLIDANVERSVRRSLLENFQTKVRNRHRRSTGRKRYTAYLTLSEMELYLKNLIKSFDFLELEEIGKSFENRPIWLLKISRNESLPIIWIDAGIHAREWIAPATAFYIIDNILLNGGSELLKNFQFYIAPNINPDGYVFSFRRSRYWRKNRARFASSQCEGVDLNRNFPFKWGVGGSSSSPCSDTFRGFTMGDQPETKAVIQKLESIKTKVKLFLTLHSYGQYILTPYGYQQGQYPKTYEKLMDMAIIAIYKIWQEFGSVYTAGSAADLLYSAAGGSDDYACGQLKIPFSYTIELPDQGSYNFLLPPAYIPLVGKEIWIGLNVFLKEMQK